MLRTFTSVLVVAVLALFSTDLGFAVSNKLVVNHFVSNSDVPTYVYVTDVEGKGPAVILYFYTMDGELIKKTSVLVPTYGTEWIEIHQLLKGTYEGSIVIESSGGNIAGEYWHLGYRSQNRTKALSLAVSAQNAAGSPCIAIQHYVSDRSVETTVFLADGIGSSEAGTVVNLEFYDESSNLLAKSRQLIPAHGSLAVSVGKTLGHKQTQGTLYICSQGTPITGECWQKVVQSVKHSCRFDPCPHRNSAEEFSYSVALPGVPASRTVVGR